MDSKSDNLDKKDKAKSKKNIKNLNEKTELNTKEEKKEKIKDKDSKNLEADLKEEIENLKEEKLRLLAEMENLRKRFGKEKIDSIKYGNINIAREILSTHDNLSRALGVISETTGLSEVTKNIVGGLKMVQKEFTTILEKHGISQIKALNKKFDHNLHQAMLEVETDKEEEGIVVQELQSGYIMHERILRPAMVGVSKKTQKNKEKK